MESSRGKGRGCVCETEAPDEGDISFILNKADRQFNGFNGSQKSTFYDMRFEI